MSQNFIPIPQALIKTQQLVKGECLFRQDDQSFAMFSVMKGEIQMVRHGENGDTLVIHHARAGETFAEAALFSTHYHCDAIATQSAEIEVFDKKSILKRMQTNPEFSLALSAHFARQIQSSRRRLEIQSIRNAQDRILAAIQSDLLSGDIKSFAANINLSQEATYRGLSALVTCGKLHKPSRGRYNLI